MFARAGGPRSREHRGTFADAVSGSCQCQPAAARGRRQRRHCRHSSRQPDMRSLIADDEEPARARLSRMLAAHPDIEIAGEACDGLEAVEKIEELRPDLLFLDIEMPGLTGFEVLQSVRRTVPLPLVIFVTGYNQHALAAFEADALAYLLKPVTPERLAQVLDRARRFSVSPDEHDREREHVLQ